jgi:hypothetical protein
MKRVLSGREKEKTRVFTYAERHPSREREGASSGQVEVKPRIVLRKEEEKKERKGIIKVAFLLPDDACVRKVDLMASRKERNEK